VATGERLTRETFLKYRKQGGYVLIHANTDARVRTAIVHPLTMIASDGFDIDPPGHPRSAATYSRVLARYVREDGGLSLMLALRKMSLMPAQRLEARVPGMRDKGRVRLGADADLAVFDLAAVRDLRTPGAVLRGNALRAGQRRFGRARRQAGGRRNPAGRCVRRSCRRGRSGTHRDSLQRAIAGGWRGRLGPRQLELQGPFGALHRLLQQLDEPVQQRLVQRQENPLALGRQQPQDDAPAWARPALQLGDEQRFVAERPRARRVFVLLAELGLADRLLVLEFQQRLLHFRIGGPRGHLRARFRTAH
jgi:hypothetical protein